MKELGHLHSLDIFAELSTNSCMSYETGFPMPGLSEDNYHMLQHKLSLMLGYGMLIYQFTK